MTGLRWLRNLIYNTLTCQNSVGAMGICWDVRFLQPCALSSQTPLSTLEMLPEVRLNTHHHIFVSAAAGLSTHSVSRLGWREQAGRTAQGSWWHRPARTAAPTSHHTAASAAPSSEGHQLRACCSVYAVTAALMARACLALVMEQLLLFLCSLTFTRRSWVLGLSVLSAG